MCSGIITVHCIVWAAILFPAHPYIESATALSDTHSSVDNVNMYYTVIVLVIQGQRERERGGRGREKEREREREREGGTCMTEKSLNSLVYRP